MMTNALTIKQLGRTSKTGGGEEITFTSGVNVIVGRPIWEDQWLKTLDYLFGDPDPAIDSLGEDISEKFDTADTRVAIDNQDYRIERCCKEPGRKSKVLVNDEALSTDELSEWLLTKLQITAQHFPQGNPYSERKWPRLTWRILLRHISYNAFGV